MRRNVLIGLLLASAAAQAAIPVPERVITDSKSIAPPANAQAVLIPIEDLAYTRGLADTAWSADGKQVFVSTNLTGRYNIWRMDVDASWPLQLAQSDDAPTGLSPSPDGRMLLFTQDSGGDEYSDVYSVPTAGGPVTRLTAQTRDTLCRNQR